MDFLNSLSKWWDRNGFAIVLLGSLILLLALWLFRRNKKGSYTKGLLTELKKISIFGPDGKVKKTRKKNKKKAEGETRLILEGLFRMAFPSVRPKFLRNPATGKNLEIDMYNKVLKLAVEYQGIQHYQFTPYFHKTELDFIKQQERDLLKKRLLQEQQIDLIEVPHNLTTPEEIRAFLCEELRKIPRLEPHLGACY